MTQPAVGIVVRTRDRPKFLRRALASITAQSFGDWQAVIVNDGGDPNPVDAAVAGLDEAHRDRIRVLHSPHSRGRWTSANLGVLATTAPLTVLHDDDDAWHPAFLDRAVAYLGENPDRDGVVSRVEIVWEERDDGGMRVVGREVFQAHLTDPLLSDQLLHNRFVPIAFVYRRSLHAELGLYDESLPVVGDWVFASKVLTRGALEFLEGEPLAYWHQRVGATGVDGNSVIASSGDHERYDRLIRDAALREYISEYGIGLPLYLTKYIDERLLQTEQSVRDSLRGQYRSTAEGRMRTWLGRQLRRVRGEPL